MNSTVVVTIVGPDKPGLVEAVAAAIKTHGGNWLESRMCRLGGQFAGLLRAAVAAEKSESLATALRGLSARGLTVVVQTDAAAAGQAVQQLQLALVGQDRPGIVQEISGILARAGANIESLETGCESAAMSGEALFTANAVVTLPAGVPAATIREALEKGASDLMVDLRVTTETKAARR